MDPEDEAQLILLKRTHDGSAEMEQRDRDALYAFIQRKLNEAKRGTVEHLIQELMTKTGYSRGRLFDIKRGRWSRTPERNPQRES